MPPEQLWSVALVKRTEEIKAEPNEVVTCLVPVVEKANGKEMSQHTEWSRNHLLHSITRVKKRRLCFCPVQWNVSEYRCSACLHTLYSLCNTVWKHSSLSCVEPLWFGLCWAILLLLMQMMVIPKKPFLLPLVEITVVILDKENLTLCNILMYIDAVCFVRQMNLL